MGNQPQLSSISEKLKFYIYQAEVCVVSIWPHLLATTYGKWLLCSSDCFTTAAVLTGNKHDSQQGLGKAARVWHSC